MSSKAATQSNQAVTAMQSNQTDEVSNIYITSTDQTLKPLTSRYDYFLKILKYETYKSLNVILNFRHSETLLPDLSSLTLLLDGTPIVTTALTKDTINQGTLQGVIPTSSLKPGYHQITIAANLHSHREVCANEFADPANWLVLESSSYIHQVDDAQSGQNGLAMFPFPFAHETTNTPWQTDVVIPDQASGSELETAYQLISSISHTYHIDANGLKVIRLSEYSRLAIRPHVIYVGTWEQMLPAWRSLLKGIPADTTDEGILSEITTSEFVGNDKRTLLFVTGKTAHDVALAGQALEYPNFVKQLTGRSAIITENMVKQLVNQENQMVSPYQLAVKDGKVTFAQLDYGSITLAGVQSASSSYTFSTPQNWLYTKDAGANIRIHYSSLMDQKRSAIIASINGTPMASKSLASGNANELQFFVPFPNDLKVGEKIELTLSVEMFMETETCADSSGVQGLRRFVTIEPGSYFLLPHMEQTSIALGQFPSPYLSDIAELKNTTIVLPANASSKELTALAKLVNFAARSATIKNITIEQATNQIQIASGNVWVIDAAGDNPYGKLLTKVAELPILSNQKELSSTMLPLSFATQKQGGAIYQMYLPKGGAVFMMTAATPEMLLDTATDFARQTDISSTTTENVAIRTTDQQTVLFSVASAPYQTFQEKIGNQMKETFHDLSSSQGQFLLFLTAFGLTVLIVVIYLFVIWWRQTKHKKKVRSRNRKRRSK